MMNIADMVRETLEDEAVAELCFETKKEIKALLRACTAERIAEACVHLAVSLFLEFGQRAASTSGATKHGSPLL